MKGGNKFQSELSKLESLLNRLNPTKERKNRRNHRAHRGGKHHDVHSEVHSEHHGGKKPDVDVRHFKLVQVDKKHIEDGGRYDLPSKTRSGKVNRRGPKDVASKVFSELCRKRNRGGDCKYNISIAETTQGSSKKVYHYEARRVALTPAERKKSRREVVEKGKKRIIENKYRNELKALGSEKRSNHKGGYF